MPWGPVMRELMTRRTAKRWLTAFLVFVGAVAAIAGLIDALFPDVFEPRGWTYLITVGVGAISWATYAARPQLSFTRQIVTPDVSITIKVGDLFDEQGHLVIGMTDTFDTELPRVIKENSVQAQLLRREYGSDIDKLDREIKKALQSMEPSAIESPQTKPKGKRKRYPLGTVITLGDVQRYYYCCAYSSMSNNLVAQSSPASLWLTLDNLWTAVRDTAQYDTVSIPVVGARLAKLTSQLSRPDLVKLIVLSFLAASRKRVVTRHLQIVVHPDDMGDAAMSELIDTLASV